MALLLIVFLRVTSCAPTPRPDLGDLSGPPPAPPPITRTECQAQGWAAAAARNTSTLNTLAWAPFGRNEIGWATYEPIIAQEIGTTCPGDSEGFAAAFAAWQGDQRLLPDGVIKADDFNRMRGVVLMRRPFVKLSAAGVCPDASDVIAEARKEEGYSGKTVWLRPGALAAYRRMVADARREVPGFADDPFNLTIFSGYRSPSEDAARCAKDGNCDGIVRARCSAHRTGLAADMYMGHAPGYRPDDSADENRRFMSRTATYRWMLRNAHRYGFVNYPFEPWHWEWTGEAP